MGLSDCIKCYDTPCTCGYDYRDWGEQRLKEHIKMLFDVLYRKTGEEVIESFKDEIIYYGKNN